MEDKHPIQHGNTQDDSSDAEEPQGIAARVERVNDNRTDLTFRLRDDHPVADNEHGTKSILPFKEKTSQSVGAEEPVAEEESKNYRSYSTEGHLYLGVSQRHTSQLPNRTFRSGGSIDNASVLVSAENDHTLSSSFSTTVEDYNGATPMGHISMLDDSYQTLSSTHDTNMAPRNNKRKASISAGDGPGDKKAKMLDVDPAADEKSPESAVKDHVDDGEEDMVDQDAGGSSTQAKSKKSKSSKSNKKEEKAAEKSKANFGPGRYTDRVVAEAWPAMRKLDRYVTVPDSKDFTKSSAELLNALERRLYDEQKLRLAKDEAIAEGKPWPPPDVPPQKPGYRYRDEWRKWLVVCPYASNCFVQLDP